MTFQAPESLSEQIAQHLGAKIIRGQLKPLERIQELKITAELNVSRGSVREALLILERRHLVNIYPRKGAVVSELSSKQVNCLYDIYIDLLMMLGVKLIGKHWHVDDLKPLIKQIDKIVQQVGKSGQPLEEIVNSGFELMRLCYPIVDNPYLAETLENFRPAISRTYFLAMQRRGDQMPKTLAFFKGLMSTVQSRDIDQLKVVIHEYGELQRTLVLQELSSMTA
jgi:DNA-binding GntR family transcriptional regulator